jgi:hypothetical protein
VTAEYVPTNAQRALVESASGFGITQDDIAAQLKISLPTLRKHFRDELDNGAFKANMKVGSNMFGLTQSNDEQVMLRACQWWTARRMGWKETVRQENSGPDGGPMEMETKTKLIYSGVLAESDENA